MKIEELNKQMLKDSQQKIEELSSIIDVIVDRLVRKYCSGLDAEMKKITEKIQNYEQKPLSDLELDNIIINLPQLIYWASEGQEILGIRADISESLKNEGFITAYHNTQGSVGQRKLEAESEVLLEDLTIMIYDRATKKIRLKVNYAMEMLQSAKKIYTKRINDSDWGNNDNSTKTDVINTRDSRKNERRNKRSF